MIKNYFLIALRTLRKHKGYSIINVTGLAIGLACCLLILLYVQEELSYDRFHEQADRIYRVVEDQVWEGRVNHLATTNAPLAPALLNDFATVEQTLRLYPYSMLGSREGTRSFQEDGFVFADSTLFEVFTFPFAEGDARTALDAPFSLVLTASTARRYFGEENALGQTLSMRDDEGEHDFVVTGVVPDPPQASHFHFDMLASFSSLRTIMPWYDNWQHPPMYTYALLSNGAEAASLEAQLPAFATKYLGDEAEGRSYFLQRLTDIRLHSQREGEFEPTGSIAYVYIFALIAVFILLIACINFMNLATARAAKRAKEVGLRKVVGAQRSQLIGQFLGESVLLAALALVLAVVLVEALLPVFNAISGKGVALSSLVGGPQLILLVALVGAVGLLAGSYPAFYLSAFRPTRVLKGATKGGTPGAATLRKGLVVFQFAISMALIIATMVVNRQLDFIQNQRLGFDKDHVVVVPLREQADQINNATLKEAWKQLPGVLGVTASSGLPGKPGGLHDFLIVPEDAREDSLELMTLTVDHDFVEALGLEVLAGRGFSEAFGTDATEAFLINESAARKLGWTEPVGNKLTLHYYLRRRVAKHGTVIGVVRDFQYHSLHRPIDPTVLHILPNTYYNDYLSVRINPNDVAGTLALLEAQWRAFNPSRPFEYTFLDEEFDALYRSEQRLAQLFSFFAGLAILIACLGLLGLAAFSAEQRTKEVGIRKVLGASAGSIVVLLSKDLLKLVLFAIVVATPLVYVAMDQWLAAFAARIEMGPGLFAVAGAAALLIALLTVSYHALRAALADPVKSLRYE